jgi:UDP-N-acetyl-D-glucosamine dehydrogenase
MADTTSPGSELEARIRTRTATVGVVGLGYVGLPLLRAFFQAGFPVIGFDVDRTKIETRT